jgi:hypothetical protein
MFGGKHEEDSNVCCRVTLATSLVAAPASPQTTGGNQGNRGCDQLQLGEGGGAGNITPANRSQENRQEVLAGLISAAVSNVGVEATALNDALNNANLQVVCLNDVLNQNDIALVEDVLNRSPILTGNRDVLSNIVRDNNILNGVEVVSVDLLSGTLYVLS